MTLLEMSVVYAEHAAVIRSRIVELTTSFTCEKLNYFKFPTKFLFSS